MNTVNGLIERVLVAYGHRMCTALTAHTATTTEPDTDDKPSAVLAFVYSNDR